MTRIRSISNVLNDSEMGSLGARVKAYERLRDTVLGVLPPLLRTSVQVGAIENETMVMRCANGTVHLRVRSLWPSILDAVRAEGFVIKEVRIKVEPMYRPPSVAKPALHRAIPRVGRLALERMSQQCAGTPVAEAIDKLLKNSY
jgi:hypothetical protein